MSRIFSVKSDASPRLASDLENLHIFTFDFNLVPALRKVKKSDIFTNKILEKIDVSSSNQILKDSIIICRSLKQVDKADLTSVLNDVFKKIVNDNLEDKMEVLPVIITTILVLHSSSKVTSMINLENCANVFLKNPSNVHVLQMFDFMLLLHLMQESADIDSATDKEKVFTALGDHLASWEPVAREIAVHALTLLIPLLGKITVREKIMHLLQCCGSGSARIRIFLVRGSAFGMRIRILGYKIKEKSTKIYSIYSRNSPDESQSLRFRFRLEN